MRLGYIYYIHTASPVFPGGPCGPGPPGGPATPCPLQLVKGIQKSNKTQYILPTYLISRWTDWSLVSFCSLYVDDRVNKYASSTRSVQTHQPWYHLNLCDRKGLLHLYVPIRFETISGTDVLQRNKVTSCHIQGRLRTKIIYRFQV